MAVREILRVGNPLLRERSREITRDELASPTMQQLIDDLIDTMHHANGAGIAAPQIGELVRIRWLSRETGWAVERVAPLALMDRAADLAAMALLLCASMIFAPTAIKGAVPVALLALCVAIIATCPRLLAALVTRTYRMTGRLPRIFVRARRATLSLDAFGRGEVLLPALVLGLAGWALEGYALHLLLGWLGADIDLSKAVAIFLFATLAGGLTGAPGGVGGAEVAMVALLSIDGTGLDVAVAATAIIRVTTLWFAVGIGMLAFPIAERLSFKGLK